VVREQSFKRAAQGPLVNSTGLLVMHFVYVIFFSHRRNAPYPEVYTGQIHTMISGSFELGMFHVTDFQFFFFADVLGSIALAGYFSIFLMWVLHRTGLLYNISRAYKVVVAVAIAFFIISYPIWDIGYGVIENLLINGSPLALIAAIPLSMLTGAFQSFFPIAGFGLMGLTLGLMLSVKNHKEDDPHFYDGQNIPTAKKFITRFAPFSFLAFIGLFVFYIVQGNKPLSILEYYRLPPALLALNLALMFWLIRLGIILFEDPDEETRMRRSKKTLSIRRFGMVTLSVYTFESVVNGIVSHQFHTLLDNPNTPVHESFTATVPIILYAVFVLAFWFVFVYLWEKVGFKYGIEYWIIKFGSRFRSTKSAKLDVTDVLYDVVSKKQPVEIIPEIKS